MSDVKRKRSVLNIKQKLEILQKLDNGESASTDAEDVLNEGNTISHFPVQQSVENLLDYMGQRGFDYGDITAIEQGNRYHQSNIVGRRSYRGSGSMVWAVIIWAWLSAHTDFHVLHGRALTTVKYKDKILDSYVGPYTGAIGEEFVLMDDNTRLRQDRFFEEYFEN
ncbi:hypothetical protein AVEN_197011-1 [Araneus ventricosus]|uniref:Uncharacterized protein n=1 Tax=Araneus ventricosus TaxID=182803 RepID=A0A4Y2EAJ4_ARAVE|nr:hypothetical protein AVEN_197011-1 [Araneus ventricosus]